MSATGITGVLDRLLGRTLVLLMLMLVFCVTWQVCSRYLLQAPGSWTEELARFLLIWIGLLGGAYAYRTRAHMGIDVLAGKLAASGRLTLRLVIALIVLFFSLVVMVAGGLQLVLVTAELQQFSAALGLPMASVYSVIPISGLIIAIYAVQEMIDARQEDSQCPS